MYATTQSGHVFLRSSCILVAASSRSHLSDQGFVKLAVTYRFHHGQVLEVIVRLEQCVTCEELDEDAPNTPYVAWKAPTQI